MHTGRKGGPADEGAPARFLRAVAARPGVAAAVALTSIALLAAALFWFQPWKLFTDDRVDEAFPGHLPARDAPSRDAVAVDQALIFSSGRFRPIAHDAAGTAALVELPGGQRVLRFEGFRVENGPDLFVYLSKAPVETQDDDDFATEFFDLGRLKGNVGAQNYQIPDELDLTGYRSVVVWCRRFRVAFAAAPIEV